MNGLALGRIVHYSPDGIKVHPAMIVKIWDESTGSVNLTVFPDWSNDGPESKSGIVWATSVKYDIEVSSPDGGFNPNTWHWPPKV